ncbi:MAG: putative toxin-antitoxin system toxin component, PIN family [Gemmatimonadetes bacterium]|nr:putative toxin-antitoxin system toxin component, PIN family [Gemmatimonadota bacterium]
MRVSLDTNVLVSATATRGICADILHLILAEHQLVLGETVLGELRRILQEKFRVPDDLALETEQFLRREAVIVTTAPALGIRIRDKDDVAVLEEAVAGEAAVLVTGDADLLDVAESAPLRILSPRSFWDSLRSGELPEE